MKLIQLNPDKIYWADRRRGIDEALVETLVVDLRFIGQLQPIVVHPSDAKGHKGTIGLNRWEACRRLGIKVWAIVSKMTEDEAREAELSENLFRSLNPLDRAVFLTGLKERYEREYPEAKHGAHGGRDGKKNENGIIPFSKLAAKRMDVSSSTITKAVAMAKSLSPAIRQRIANSDLVGRQKELFTLASMTPEEQIKALDLIDEQETPITVDQAKKVIRGHADPADTSTEETQFRKLMDTWNRCDDPKARRRFLKQLIDKGVLQADAIKGVK